MGFQISPGVLVSEIDLTTVVPAVATTSGGFAGRFNWGPVEKRVLVTSEDNLVARFGYPNANTADSFFTAANFLAYGNNLKVVRALESDANNATSSGNGALIKNDDIWQTSWSNGISTYGSWAARYPGDLGNSLKVVLCPSSSAFSQNLTSDLGITMTVDNAANTINASASISSYINVGDLVSINGGSYLTVTSLVGTSNITVNVSAYSSVTSGPITRKWAYSNYFDSAPGTSAYAAQINGSDDELHQIGRAHV